MFKLFLLLILGGFSSLVFGGQSAYMKCLSSHYQKNHGNVCDQMEIYVNFTADGDVGKPGGYAIGVQLANGDVAYWTVSGGWKAPSTNDWVGDAESVDGYHTSLPASQSFKVYEGSRAALCSMVGGQSFNIWAGYGALQPDKQQETDSLSKLTTFNNIEHIKETFIRNDGQQGNKYAVVYTQESSFCSVPHN